MSSNALKILLNRCLVDQDFYNLLLSQPQKAIQEYNLREAECEALVTIHATSLVDLVRQLLERGLTEPFFNEPRYSKNSVLKREPFIVTRNDDNS